MRIQKIHLLISYAVIIAAVVASPANANDLWGMCGDGWQEKWKIIDNVKQRTDGAIEIDADSSRVVNRDKKEIVELTGNVSVQQNDLVLRADSAKYHGKTDHIVATGKVKIQDEGIAIRGSSAEIQISSSKGAVTEADYRLLSEHMRGEAESIALEGKGKLRLLSSHFTSCNPGSYDWYLRASEIHLDIPENSGSAKHVRIEFMGVPFFYTPYITFPLGKRKTGLLLPTTGSSESTGSDFQLPLYVNLAPNYDLTLTPRSMQTRGTQLNTELRYMGENSKGVLNYEYLDYDMQLQEQRHAYFYQHNSTLAKNWRMSWDLNYVSDEEYINELWNGLGNVALTHLESKGDFSYQANTWNSGIRYQSFLPLLGSSQQYQRQPQLTFSGAWPLFGGFDFSLYSELVRLDKETGDIAERRLYEPALSWGYRGMAGYVESKVKYGSANYQITYQLTDVSEEQFAERSSFSIETGIYLDRNFSAFGKDYVHSLEPQLYYLYIPYVDQTAIPVFDTSAAEFNYSSLFRDDRFTGADRWGDTRQVTTALTTRFIEESSGREIFSASIGQINYLKSTQVVLRGEEVVDESTKTDLAAQLKSEPNEYSKLKMDFVWDNEEDRLATANGQLAFKSDKRHVLRINYRYRYLQQRHIDLALYWPITNNWRLLARGFHDIENDQSMEKMAGLEYESCCWAFRMVQKKNVLNSGITTITTEPDQLEESVSIWFQFELKGLGNFGNKADNFIERDVLGDKVR